MRHNVAVRAVRLGLASKCVPIDSGEYAYSVSDVLYFRASTFTAIYLTHWIVLAT
jgi:hypothetical protein